MYLTSSGAKAYFENTIFSYMYGQIDDCDFNERLYVLKMLTHPKNKLHIFINKWLESENLFWEETIQKLNFADQNDGHDDNDMDVEGGDKQISNNSPKDKMFFLSITGKLGVKWEFHQADKDFFPSIPHGHSELPNMKIKLDAYLGFIYDSHKNNKERESRQFIIELWNDSKFRKFAEKAIVFYKAYNPRFTWRVRNYRRLPRVR